MDAAIAAWEELAGDLRRPRRRLAGLAYAPADRGRRCSPRSPTTPRRLWPGSGIATERAQFARTPQRDRGLDVDVAAVRLALLERRTTRQRLRADVLPRSVLSRVGGAAADVLDRVDDAVSAHPFASTATSSPAPRSAAGDGLHRHPCGERLSEDMSQPIQGCDASGTTDAAAWSELRTSLV